MCRREEIMNKRILNIRDIEFLNSNIRYLYLLDQIEGFCRIQTNTNPTHFERILFYTGHLQLLNDLPNPSCLSNVSGLLL